jgi:hypothetical protein
MSRSLRPDPTTLDTTGAIAVLTERVGSLADAVEHMTSAIGDVPARVVALEKHDGEQDDEIACAQRTATEALGKIDGIDRSLATVAWAMRFAAKAVAVAAGLAGIAAVLHTLGVIP